MTIEVVYVTSSDYKREEIEAIAATRTLNDGRLVGEVFEFRLVKLSIKEHLEIDIRTMVLSEVTNAYSQIKVPCIVEHAGIVFSKHLARGYPGGLTKPMWDSLGVEFVSETNSAGEGAVARACIAYCDGTKVHTFTGETPGRIADGPTGGREFYWDTVFIPERGGGAPERTYAEIVGEEGLESKVAISQSASALLAFMEFRLENRPTLWPA